MTEKVKVNEKSELARLITKIPKTDLHLHLDGSIRLETLIDIAKLEKIVESPCNIL